MNTFNKRTRTILSDQSGMGLLEAVVIMVLAVGLITALTKVVQSNAKALESVERQSWRQGVHVLLDSTISSPVAVRRSRNSDVVKGEARNDALKSCLGNGTPGVACPFEQWKGFVLLDAKGAVVAGARDSDNTQTARYTAKGERCTNGVDCRYRAYAMFKAICHDPMKACTRADELKVKYEIDEKIQINGKSFVEKTIRLTDKLPDGLADPALSLNGDVVIGICEIGQLEVGRDPQSGLPQCVALQSRAPGQGVPTCGPGEALKELKGEKNQKLYSCIPIAVKTTCGPDEIFIADVNRKLVCGRVPVPEVKVTPATNTQPQNARATDFHSSKGSGIKDFAVCEYKTGVPTGVGQFKLDWGTLKSLIFRQPLPIDYHRTCDKLRFKVETI